MTEPYCRACQKKTSELVFLSLDGCVGNKKTFFCMNCFLHWLRMNPTEINEFKNEYYTIKYSNNWS